jgi:hypothetical protein
MGAAGDRRGGSAGPIIERRTQPYNYARRSEWQSCVSGARQFQSARILMFGFRSRRYPGSF